MNMTYDGWIISITDDGWVVLIKRDFSEYHTLQLTGAEVAPVWNQYMLDSGRRQGAATWVRNGPAIDEKGNIWVPSLQHMHKIVWDGEKLSKDPADGAWVVPYSNKGPISVTFDDIIDPSTGQPFTFENVNVGSGSTASLMGYGDEDRFVVITDGDEVMNMVLFWRDEIPQGWEQLPNAPSRRIAGMLRADIGFDDAEAVQTEQSVVVGGYGAFVVNNAPASKPIVGSRSAGPQGSLGKQRGFFGQFSPYRVQWRQHGLYRGRPGRQVGHGGSRLDKRRIGLPFHHGFQPLQHPVLGGADGPGRAAYAYHDSRYRPLRTPSLRGRR
jgi:hypothetical protein